MGKRRWINISYGIANIAGRLQLRRVQFSAAGASHGKLVDNLSRWT